MEKIAWKRQRSSDSGGNWRRFRSVSTFDICQIVRQGVRGIAGGALRLIREPPPPLDHRAVAHRHRHSHKLHNSAFPLPFVWKRLTSKSTHARPTHSGARSSGKGSEYSCTGSVLQLGLLHHLVVKGLQSGLCGTLGRKPGVKDILRAEIASCCWEHEQAVRVSFTHHGSSQCVLSDQNSNNFSTIIISRTHHRSCQCCVRWTSWNQDLQRQGTSYAREAACSREACIWRTELPLQHIRPSNMAP